MPRGPYGMYDVGRNCGHVCVGKSADTSQFAVNSLRSGWQAAQALYSGCRHLRLLADGGGSNSSRGRLWKRELQDFATETGLTITVCHDPPGISKWNWIEHRLFSFLSMNGVGEPLRTLDKLLSLIRGTTTTTGLEVTGLEVTAELDARDEPQQVKVPNAEFKSIQLQRHNICPQWNYSITPKKLSEVKNASRLINSSPYPACADPCCSTSTIRRPISQYVAVITAFTARADVRRAVSNSNTTSPNNPP